MQDASVGYGGETVTRQSDILINDLEETLSHCW